MTPGFMHYLTIYMGQFFLNNFKKNVLQRGILTEMNPGFSYYLYGTIFFLKPLQDEWVKKGHTDSNSQT